MRTLAYFIVYILTNSLVAQAVFQSEDILVMNDSIQLPGTLKFQNSPEAQPLVIFIQGSGDPDRNGNQPSFNVHADYINQLGTALAEHGIAFFSYDKRNVTKTNFESIKKSYVFTDIVKDASAVIDHFKDDLRFKEMIIVGHSQGSLVGMLAANEHVDKYISLAGLGTAVDEAFVRQISNQDQELGNIARQHADELKSTGDIKEINLYLVSLFGKGNHKFLIDYFAYNPSDRIKELAIPILIINGTKDIQVPISDAELLHQANPKSELVLIENMNHVLKRIDKDEDNLASYYSPDFPLSEELVNVIVEFVND